jgi:hypothetical protein
MLSIPPTRQTTPAALQFFSVTADSVAVDDVTDVVVDDVTDDVVDAATRLVEVDTADSNLLGGFEENTAGRSGFVLDVEYSDILKEYCKYFRNYIFTVKNFIASVDYTLGNGILSEIFFFLYGWCSSVVYKCTVTQ